MHQTCNFRLLPVNLVFKARNVRLHLVQIHVRPVVLCFYTACHILFLTVLMFKDLTRKWPKES